MPRKPDPKPPDEKRKKGRPKRCTSPRINYDQLDRMLVFGEVVPVKNGPGTRIVYPSYRKVAEKFGVSVAYVAEYARTHNCMARREDTAHTIEKKADEILIERRAMSIALSREDELRIIDSYLQKFGEALEAGRVRFDDPADFDRIMRLKEFLRGGADSRAEVNATISLGDIQARYRRMQTVINASPEERGVATAALVAPASVVAAAVASGVEVAEPPATEHTAVVSADQGAAGDP